MIEQSNGFVFCWFLAFGFLNCDTVTSNKMNVLNMHKTQIGIRKMNFSQQIICLIISIFAGYWSCYLINWKIKCKVISTIQKEMFSQVSFLSAMDNCLSFPCILQRSFYCFKGVNALLQCTLFKYIFLLFIHVFVHECLCVIN